MKILLMLSITLANVTLAKERIGNFEAAYLDYDYQNSVDHDKIDIDLKRLTNFTKGLANFQVAVVSVEGMVCDFCARGLEKLFKKDQNVKKIDVDLNNGKVLIAYSKESKISFDDIKQKTLANGQNATNLRIIKIAREGE